MIEFDNRGKNMRRPAICQRRDQFISSRDYTADKNIYDLPYPHELTEEEINKTAKLLSHIMENKVALKMISNIEKTTPEAGQGQADRQIASGCGSALTSRPSPQLAQYIDKIYTACENGKEMQIPESRIQETLEHYNMEVKRYSAEGEVKHVKRQDLRIITGDELKAKRRESNDYGKKREMIQEWEQRNNQPWPRYVEDVFNEKGNPIRKKGMRYDRHHVHPLGMGGGNTAENITPIHVKDHGEYNGEIGIHRKDGPYAKIDEILRREATI